MEPDFGLLQLGVRFYDPEVGRFTQRDRLDSLARYTYVGGQSIVKTDATGYIDDALKKYYLCVGSCVVKYVLPGADVMLDVIKIKWPRGRPPSDWATNPDYLKKLKVQFCAPWKKWGSSGPGGWRAFKWCMKNFVAIVDVFELVDCLYGCIKKNPGAMCLP